MFFSGARFLAVASSWVDFSSGVIYVDVIPFPTGILNSFFRFIFFTYLSRVTVLNISAKLSTKASWATVGGLLGSKLSNTIIEYNGMMPYAL